jgi:hypothetical protein
LSDVDREPRDIDGLLHRHHKLLDCATLRWVKRGKWI